MYKTWPSQDCYFLLLVCLGFLNISICLFHISYQSWEDINAAATFQYLVTENLVPETVSSTEPRGARGAFPCMSDSLSWAITVHVENSHWQRLFLLTPVCLPGIFLVEKSLDLLIQRRINIVFNKIKSKASYYSSCL